MDIYDVTLQKITAIEHELQRLGMRSDTPIEPEKLENMTPFGIDKMSPAEWLQFVLIPRVHEILDVRGNFPEKSDVAVRAAHNLEGEEYTQLISLLGQFDLLINERISIL